LQYLFHWYFSFTINVCSQSNTVFVGKPLIKISEGGIQRTPENITARDSENLKCVVSQIGDKYYWASRENRELVLTQSGAFISFMAKDGIGYIRIIKSEMKDEVSVEGSTEQQYDYVEHLLIGLKSVTYYGVNQK
jgi:hypothetical protein